MIIKTARSRLASSIDAVLTAIAWIAFTYLFGASLVEILSGRREGGPSLGAIAEALPTMATLGIYAVVAVVNALILLGWARYNAYRFRGVDRRRPSAPLSDAQLAQSFGLPLQMRVASTQAKSMTIHHNKDGHISDIRIHSDAAPFNPGTGSPA